MNSITRILLPIIVALATLYASLTIIFVLLGGQIPTDEIAFDTQRENDFDIYLLDTQRNITARLTRSDANEHSPAWSPDGEYLAYVYESVNERAIYIMQANGRSPRRLTEVTQLTMNPSLAWSPDGMTLALAAVDDSNTQGIFLIGVDGSNLRRLSATTGNAFTPTWSTDEQIAFSFSPVSNAEIYVMNIAQPESFQHITQEMYTDTSPAWSPDGSKIAFMSDRDGGSDIYLMNPDGTELEAVAHEPSRETMPAWSPDSEWIAFVSNRSGNSDLFIIRRDGTDLQQLTFDSADEFRPAWRP